MKRFRLVVISIVLTAVMAFVVREVINARNKAIVFPVVRELGGRIYSIPFEPIGTEYAIVFRERHFTVVDLDRLVILNCLIGRNTIGIIFSDTNVTQEDVQRLRRIMPKVHFTRTVDGKQIP